jgi:hypothetical protein
VESQALHSCHHVGNSRVQRSSKSLSACVEGEGGLGVEWGDYTECGDDLEVLVALIDKGKVSTLGANTQIYGLLVSSSKVWVRVDLL